MKQCFCGNKLPPHHSKYCSKVCLYKAKYARHKDSLRLRSKQWDKQNPEKRRLIAKRWRDKHPARTSYYRKHNRLRNPLEILRHLWL